MGVAFGRGGGGGGASALPAAIPVSLASAHVWKILEHVQDLQHTTDKATSSDPAAAAADKHERQVS